MSEDEKYLYREYEMENSCKINLDTYKRMYDAVSLMALDYNKQVLALPNGINIADEIALVFDDEVIAIMNILYESGMLSLEECRLINDIGNILSEMSKKYDKSLWTIDALKQSKSWEECRKKAKKLLSLLCKLE